MSTIHSNIPLLIGAFINDHLQGAFLINVMKIREDEGRVFYLAEVEDRGIVRWMKFTEAGLLVDQDAGPSWWYDSPQEVFMAPEYA